ncbi:Na+/H+ antiporter NhaC [Neobacillus bataviensis LMG 21833]|uniref:Na+/H+ antiporter NhaC n=1 Tax=Neobacillus bataviensis LMG 21833 TaxID=1117379 RepID=K6BUN4_9BACI|nr:Na+/H+ antiporter NhaC [Neobacillus bataviensis]EKN62625.1 Na+/H+ antiporter NhaC [Neobacillus bataviensis LMG 21833]
MSNVKKPNFLQALLPLIILMVVAVFSISQWKTGMYIPLLSGIVFTALLGLYLGHKWTDIEKFIIEGVSRALLPLFILFMIGLIVGTWILSGAIPTLIYYSLDFINPSIFIPIVVLVTGVLSISTGSSFTSISTIGLAFMAVGQGMGFPPALVAGAVLSGAYFGDKLSPLSDTTNVAPAVSDTDLFSHIKHMLWDTIPAYFISVVIFYFVGLQYTVDSANFDKINEMMITLNNSFTISPILLLLPIVTILLVLKKYPVLPSLLIISILGGIMAMVMQGSSIAQVIQSMTSGYAADTGIKEVDALLNKGGILSMLNIVGLILLATALGGLLEGVQVFQVLLNTLINKARSSKSLIMLTLTSAAIIALASGSQFLVLILTGRAFANTYKERGLDTVNLSRCLEAIGTVSINLVPWSVNAVFAAGILGVSAMEFIPFSYFILLVPIINIIYGLTGFTIKKKTYPETNTNGSSKNSDIEIVV